MGGSLQLSKECHKVNEATAAAEGCTCDGSVDFHGHPAIRERTGKWTAGIIILLNQGFCTLAFFGVGVNLVLFLTRILEQNTADAANTVSKWTGTVYLFSLVGAFLSDSQWGRYKTCAIFQAIFVAGLVLLSLTTQVLLLKPGGCGKETPRCGPGPGPHKTWVTGFFYISIYMIALGNGGYQPNIATFGADQFDEEDVQEGHSKVAFFSYFYLALNLGSLFSNTVLVYLEDKGMWTYGFWASAASAFAALLLFMGGTKRYRYFRTAGNPFSRFCQVIVAAAKKRRMNVEEGVYYSVEGIETSKAGHMTKGLKFLDRAAFLTQRDVEMLKTKERNPWLLCPISQVEDVKCILRLLPIWLCTIIYSVVFTQMASLFVVQGSVMNTNIFSGFKVPPASMSTFDILSVAVFIFIHRRILDPLAKKMRSTGSQGLGELQRMGIGLVIAILAMLSAGIVERYRIKFGTSGCEDCHGSSSLSIFWQVPQYALIGASEVFMYVGQLEFFNAEAPDGLKSFGSALCMTSISLGNYVSSLIVSIVMKISTMDNMPGWIPGNLNMGHLDRFYFLLAALTAADLIVYIACAMWYKNMKSEARGEDKHEDLRIGV